VAPAPARIPAAGDEPICKGLVASQVDHSRAGSSEERRVSLWQAAPRVGLHSEKPNRPHNSRAIEPNLPFD
jgi:hypothetical protein